MGTIIFLFFAIFDHQYVVNSVMDMTNSLFKCVCVLLFSNYASVSGEGLA